MQLDEGRDDTTLAQRIKEGDHTAFRHFFDRYHEALLIYLSKRGLAREAAQDIVQNAFIKIWETRDQIEPSKSLKAFLFRIGYTRALNYFRDNSKFEHGADLSAKPDSANVHQEASYNQMHSYLISIVHKMPERRRAVFELCFLQELTYREAAQALDVSVKTVENHMALALKTVRAAMATLDQ